jgi:hypothetical protein
MKRSLTAMLALILLAALALSPLSAQAGGSPSGATLQATPAAPGQKGGGKAHEELLALRKELRELSLSDQEIKAIGDILDRKADDLAKAQAEIRIVQARLERLMLDANPSMDEIQKLVRSSLDWEYSIRMIRIQQSLELRKLLGDQRWATLQRLMRAFQKARQLGLVDARGGGELPAALAASLGKL